MKKRWAILRWASTLGVAAAILLFFASGFFSIELASGRMNVSPADFSERFYSKYSARDPEPWPEWKGAIGIGWLSYGGGLWQLSVSLWYAVLIPLVPFAVAWTAHFRVRSSKNRCPDCNYSLTGLAPGSPCPECGKRGEAKA